MEKTPNPTEGVDTFDVSAMLGLGNGRKMQAQEPDIPLVKVKRTLREILVVEVFLAICVAVAAGLILHWLYPPPPSPEFHPTATNAVSQPSLSASPVPSGEVRVPTAPMEKLPDEQKPSRVDKTPERKPEASRIAVNVSPEKASDATPVQEARVGEPQGGRQDDKSSSATATTRVTSSCRAYLAILRNGFSIRHQRHKTIGSTTHLYLNDSSSGTYTDVPTDEIVDFECEPTPSTKPLIIPHCVGARVAVLLNGFTIRHDHVKILGSTARLFLSADDSSFTDVPAADIMGFECDTPLPIRR